MIDKLKTKINERIAMLDKQADEYADNGDGEKRAELLDETADELCASMGWTLDEPNWPFPVLWD